MQTSHHKSKQRHILTRDEERRLLEACSHHLRPVVIAAIDTGMRRGELVALRWSDVDLERRVITLQDTKSTQERRISISDRLSEVLTTHYLATGPLRRHRVFGADNVRIAFSQARAKAQLLDVRFYDLRLTHATRLAHSDVVN